MDINDRIAQRVRDLRKQHGFTLDALAEHSGVSRSMISLIERGQTSPTAAVLDKLSAVPGLEAWASQRSGMRFATLRRLAPKRGAGRNGCTPCTAARRPVLS